MQALKDIPTFKLLQELENRGVCFIRWTTNDVAAVVGQDTSEEILEEILVKAFDKVNYNIDLIGDSFRYAVSEIYETQYLLSNEDDKNKT